MAKQLKDQPLPKGDYYSVTKKCPKFKNLIHFVATVLATVSATVVITL
jgi:hypothetical protein